MFLLFVNRSLGLVYELDIFILKMSDPWPTLTPLIELCICKAMVMPTNLDWACGWLQKAPEPDLSSGSLHPGHMYQLL